jgi:peptidoglycan hydrolase CwlO-like protein
MPTTGIESNSPSEQLGKLGALLSDLEANGQWDQQNSSVPSAGDLKKLISSIESSISDLEKQITSNESEQNALVAESRKLKKEIRELSRKLAEEVSKLTNATKRL